MAPREGGTLQTRRLLILGLFVPVMLFAATPLAAAKAGRPPGPDNAAQHYGVPRSPDVSATQIVFLYDGELWLVPREGGTAVSLTKEAGPKGTPRFSPDGQTIAFTGNYDGIYTIPVNGGAVSRVSHHPGATDLCDWTPNGRLLFMTDTFFPPADFGDQAYLRELYVVPAAGGLPSKLPIAYGANGAISPDGKWLAYTSYAEGRSEHRAHYQGGFAPDIWLLNLSTHQSQKITEWLGTDTSPMWHGKTIYYLSDAGREGRRNIWSYELASGRRRQITKFEDYDIKWPSIGPGQNGKGEIVFVKGTDLFLLDLASETAHAVKVTLPKDRIDSRPRSLDASKFVTNWNLSSDGKQAVVEARGRLWTVPSETGLSPRLLTNDAAVAERDPVWSPDGEWIAYFSDASGEYQLYVAPSDHSGAPRQLTYLEAGFRFWPSWSPDSHNIAFSDSSGSIYLHNLGTHETRKIHEDPTVRQPALNWSPDSSWLAFTASSNSLQVICFYDVAKGESHQVTGGGYNDKSPTFDRRGDYLFFVSDRNYDALTYDSVDYSTFVYPSTELLMALPLRRDLPSPWQLRSKGASSQSEITPEHVSIDFDDIERRAVIIASEGGKYSNLVVTNQGQLLYTFMPTGSGPSLRILGSADSTVSGMGAPKALLNGVGDFRLSNDGSKLFVRQNDRIARMDLVSGQKLEDSLHLAEMIIEIDPRAEWKQIFTEAWRLYRDFFYDPAMRGASWPAMREKYAKLLDGCADRQDVDYVIGEMLAEVGSSHVYLTPPPGNQPPQEVVGMLGVDFDLDHDAYRIKRIYDAAPSDTTARNPLRQPGVDVKQGDYLLAVNGKPLDVKQDPWAAFTGLAGKDVTLKVSSKPVLDQDARDVVVQPGYIEALYRHRAWVEALRAHVERKSEGKVGYVYVKMTSEYGFREFTRQFGPQVGKQALIIDARWNQGGHIPFHLLDVLRRQVYLYSVDLRRGVSQRNPSYLQDGPKCVLINGVTESGGDLFAYLVQKSAAAKLIGTRTMGAMAGAGGLYISFIDGGFSLVPTVGFYDLNGKWTVEGQGVQPDVEVADNPAAMINGADPQLDAAIKLLMTELRNRPKAPQVGPPFRRDRALRNNGVVPPSSP